MRTNREWGSMHGYDEISQLLYIDDEGVVRWKVDRGSNKIAGRIFGKRLKQGKLYYRSGGLTLGGKRRDVLAHRIAWLLYTGAWPVGEIDHIDGDGENNRQENLQDVDHQTNMRNQRLRSTNTSGCCGVYWHTRNKSWQSLIKVSGRCIYLGYFDNLFDAACARKSAENKYGFNKNHGRSA